MPDNRDQKCYPSVRGESGFDVAVREAEEIHRKRQIDIYGLALMMIREGCANPANIARRALDEFHNSPHRLGVEADPCATTRG